MGLLIRTIVTAVAIWVATLLVDGITAFLKPVIQVLGCPLYVLTLGLFALVVNALLLELASWIADKLNVPFHVDGFWSAFWGAIIIGIVSFLLNLFVPDGERQRS
jgi:putative membrane protein